MSDITFTSRITAVKTTDFSRYTSSFTRNAYVDFPWNISSSRVATDVFTDHIADCTSCLITDGKKALLMHLCPSNENNHNINKIFNYISNNLNFNDNLQAVLVGSQPEKESLDIFNKIKNLLKQLNIPTSIFQTGKARTHLAYRTCKDEVIISSNHIDSEILQGKNNENVLKNSFEYVKISDYDEV